MTDQLALGTAHTMKQKEDFLDRVWTEPDFRKKLTDDPKSILYSMGADIPENLEIRVIYDTDKMKYLHIPTAPPEGEISDEQLYHAQGGIWTTPWCVAIAITATVVTASGVLTVIDLTVGGIIE